MKDTQLKALMRVVYNDEQLKEMWAKPREYNFPTSNKIALISLLVVSENDKLKWSVSIRLKHRKKPTIKAVSTWSQSERWAATRMLRNELDGCGRELGTEEFDSKYAMHFNKPLTGDELSVVVNPHILGN